MSPLAASRCGSGMNSLGSTPSDFPKSANLPVMKSPCPADGNTQREDMKQLLAKLDRENKGLRYRIFGAIQKGEIDGFKEMGRMQGIKNYELDDTEEAE